MLNPMMKEVEHGYGSGVRIVKITRVGSELVEGSEVWVVGGSHVDPKFVQAIEETVKDVAPDTVAVELCPLRAAMTKVIDIPGVTTIQEVRSLGGSLPPLADMPLKTSAQRLKDLRQESSWPSARGYFYVLLALQGVRLFEWGTEFGGDQRAAVYAAREAGSHILLADRDQALTLARAFRVYNMSIFEGTPLTETLWFVANVSLGRREVATAVARRILDRKFRELDSKGLSSDASRQLYDALLSAYLTGQVPLGAASTLREVLVKSVETDLQLERINQSPLYKAMEEERDELLAATLRECPGQKIVAVVGGGHVDGICSMWDTVTPVAIDILHRPKPAGYDTYLWLGGFGGGTLATIYSAKRAPRLAKVVAVSLVTVGALSTYAWKEVSSETGRVAETIAAALRD